MTNAEPLLRARDLKRTYGSRRLLSRSVEHRALNGVSFEVQSGEILGIVGPSGCGKSTLARIVASLDQPTSGSLHLDGRELAGLSDRELAEARRAVQMVFQDPYGSLDPRQSVGRIVAEPLHLLRPRPGRTESQGRIMEALRLVGLPEEAAMRRPHEFSGGQRQRIAIARAIVTRPRLVVADEPVSALDLSVRAQILNLLLDLQEREGMAVLFISHDLAAVGAVADRIAVMDEGRIVEIGPAEEILRSPRHPRAQALAAARLDV